jgi:hypothetical protein
MSPFMNCPCSLRYRRNPNIPAGLVLGGKVNLLGLASGSEPWTIATNGSGGVLVIGADSGKLYIAYVETGS